MEILPPRPPLRTYYLQHKAYFQGMALLALSLFILIIVSVVQSWLAIALFATASFILVIFRIGTMLYIFYITDDPALGETIFTMARYAPDSEIVHIGITEHASTVILTNRLIGGMLTVIDCYTPQLFSGRWINDARNFRLHTYNDPRVRYLESDIELFPFADGEVEMVLIEDTLGKMNSRADMRDLLLEVQRVLRDDGLVFVVEWDKSGLAVMLRGLSAVSTPNTAFWHDLFHNVGLEKVEDDRAINDVQRLYTYRRPKIHTGSQLEMQFY